MHHSIISSSTTPLDPVRDLSWLMFTDFRDEHVAVRPALSATASKVGFTVTVDAVDVHNLQVGQEVAITGDLNETVTVGSVTDSNTFVYTSANSGSQIGLSLTVTPTNRPISTLSNAGTANVVSTQPDLTEQPYINKTDETFPFAEGNGAIGCILDANVGSWGTLGDILYVVAVYKRGSGGGVFFDNTKSGNEYFRMDSSSTTNIGANVKNTVSAPSTFNQNYNLTVADPTQWGLVELQFTSSNSKLIYNRAQQHNYPSVDLDWAWGIMRDPKLVLRNHMLALFGVSTVDHWNNNDFIDWIDKRYSLGIT